MIGHPRWQAMKEDFMVDLIHRRNSAVYLPLVELNMNEEKSFVSSSALDIRDLFSSKPLQHDSVQIAQIGVFKDTRDKARGPFVEFRDGGRLRGHFGVYGSKQSPGPNMYSQL